jgi:hypothetical protein
LEKSRRKAERKALEKQDEKSRRKAERKAGREKQEKSREKSRTDGNDPNANVSE